jgi:thiamine-phosphate pyrophosphorylase
MFRLVVISPPAVEDHHLPVINDLLKENIVFHIRLKEKDTLYTSEILNHIEKKHHDKIVVHQDYYLAAEYKIRGIHLSEKNRLDFTSLKLKNYNLVSASIHMMENYEVIRTNFEYVLYAPVFGSISKPGYHPNKSWEKIREEVQTFTDPSQLVALGGITDKNVSIVKEAGFGGAAILGSIWSSPDPLTAFYDLANTARGVER